MLFHCFRMEKNSCLYTFLFFPKTEQMLAVNCTYRVPGYISGKDLYLPEIVFVFSVTYQTRGVSLQPKASFFTRGCYRVPGTFILLWAPFPVHALIHSQNTSVNIIDPQVWILKISCIFKNMYRFNTGFKPLRAVLK